MLKKICIRILILFFVVSSVGCSSDSSKSVFNNSKNSDITSKYKDDMPDNLNSSYKNIPIINGNIPASAKYIDSLYTVTEIKVNIDDLGKKIEKKLGRKPKVLVSSLHMTNDWNRLVSQSAIDAGKEAGAEVIAMNAQGSWNKQVSDIESGISNRVDAIVVAGGIASSLQEVIKKANGLGIPITTVDIPSPHVLTDVTSDNFSGAAMLAMQMALDMKGKGNIAVIYSPGWHSIDIRRWMLDVVMKDWPGIRIVSEQPVDEEDAVSGTMATMESVLQRFPEKGSLNAVYAVFGLAGIGAAKAIEASGRSEDIPVYTVDADIIVLKDMLKKEGAIKACIGQTTNQLGYTATVAAMKGIIGETEEIRLQTFCPITLVTRENAEEVGKHLYGDEWR